MNLKNDAWTTHEAWQHTLYRCDQIKLTLTGNWFMLLIIKLWVASISTGSRQGCCQTRQKKKTARVCSFRVFIFSYCKIWCKSGFFFFLKILPCLKSFNVYVFLYLYTYTIVFYDCFNILLCITLMVVHNIV